MVQVAVAEQARTRRPKRSSTVGARAAGYVLAIGTWHLVSTYLINPVILPSPTRVATRMMELAQSGELWRHFSATLRTCLISLVILYVLGALLGIAMGVNRWVEGAFRNWLTLMMSLPGILIILAVLLVMGLNPAGPILAIVLTNFAFVTINVWEGVSAIPTELTEMARTFGVSRWRTVRQVLIPSLAPFLFTALVYAFALTWKITMLAELFGSSRGMGYMFRLSFNTFSVASLLAWAVWAFLLFLVLERGVLQPLERRFFRWREGV